MPGGLLDMVLLGDQRGGDMRIIALVHSARILLIVFTVPFLVQLLGGTVLGPRVQPGLSLLDAPWQSHVWLVATAILGAFLGRWLRLPVPFVMGPLMVSAVIHVLGISDFRPSPEIVSAAQLVLGTFLGCSFVGAAPRQILHILALSLGSTIILLVITALFAFGVSRISDYGFVPLLLAYSPGGLAEMSLIALALQIEVAFVAAHHLARIFIVVAGADAIFRFLGSAGKTGP
jgi:membrane AbrB-like protein